MVASHRFDVAQVALRGDPIEKRRFSGLVAQPCRLECLLGLWDQLVAEKFDVMMKRLNLCQLIAQYPQRFLLFALKSLLGSCKICARFAHPRRILAWIYPRDCERHARVKLADCFCGIIIALALDHQCRVRNPCTM